MRAQDEREAIEKAARYMFENRTRELDQSPDEEDEWEILPWRDEWIEGAETALEGFRAAGFHLTPAPSVTAEQAETIERVQATITAHRPSRWRSFANESLVLRCCGVDFGKITGRVDRHDVDAAESAWEAHLAAALVESEAMTPTPESTVLDEVRSLCERELAREDREAARSYPDGIKVGQFAFAEAAIAIIDAHLNRGGES